MPMFKFTFWRPWDRTAEPYHVWKIRAEDEGMALEAFNREMPDAIDLIDSVVQLKSKKKKKKDKERKR